MRGSPKRKLAVLTAASGIAAGLAVFGSSPAVRAAESGAQTRPSGVEVKNADDGRIELRADTIRLQIDGKPGEPSDVIRAEGANGQPVILRLVADDTAPPAGKDGQDDSDIVRRLRERRQRELGEGPGLPPAGDALRALRERRAEAVDEAAKAESDIARRLRERRAQNDAQPGTFRIEAVTRGENPEPEKVRELVGDLAKRAVSVLAPGKKEKMTFLGVGASPAPPVLTHQLHLPADFGLVVDEVVPDSPADKAGLKEFDLLQKLDEQLLVDDRQLTALIHSHKPGETVTLTVIREGKPLTLKAKLGEHEEAAEGDHRFMLQFGLPPGAQGGGPEGNATFRLAPGAEAGPAAGSIPWVPERGIVAPPPLPPAASVAPPPREGGKPEEPKIIGARRLPETKPPAAVPSPSAADDEARRLEEELRALKNTADELRAQVEARKKQEAEDQKANGPVDRDQKEGEKP